MHKRCFKCGEVRPLDDFYRYRMMADGHLNKCKSCAKRDVANRYVAKRAEISARVSEMRTPEQRAMAQEGRRRHRARHPERERARAAVTRAVGSGRLQRRPCEACGEAETQAHHEDYSRPLDVVWLCFVCHRARHGQIASARKSEGAWTR